MYKKVILVFSSIFFLNHYSNAENATMCKAGKDSMKIQFSRGELGFYIPLKSNPSVFNYVKINADFYHKTPTRNTSSNIAPKDTSKVKTQKLLVDFFQNKGGKSQPLDTNVDFKMCYNLAFQPKLDSVFKCDFFRRADSILRSYDKQGKGYKNVDFQGGAGALQKFMEKNVTLPKEAKPSDTDKLIRVYYAFFVDEKGAISEIKLMKSNCKVCEESILAAVNKLPAFLPATEAGKPKKVKYILPYTKIYTKPKE